MAQPPAPVAFTQTPQPLIPGGTDRWTERQLQSIEAALRSAARFVPQVATQAPSTPFDGMMRLARYPWWPVAGQSADGWVYYDAVGAVWRLLGTAPTSSH